jgi:hypothetical protein
MGYKKGKGNNCDECAEKHCKEVVANRAKLRATRLQIQVLSPLFSQLSLENAASLKSDVLDLLLGDIVLLDSEANHRSHQFSDTREISAFRTTDFTEFYAYRSSYDGPGQWNVWVGIEDGEGKMDYSIEEKIVDDAGLFQLLIGFIAGFPIGYYASSNGCDINRLRGLYSIGGGDFDEQEFLNLGYEVTFRLFGPYGAIQTPDLCQPTIHKYLFKAGEEEVEIPGSLDLKKKKKVINDVYMLFNIWNALKLVFDSYISEGDEGVERENDFDGIDPADVVLFGDDDG